MASDCQTFTPLRNVHVHRLASGDLKCPLTHSMQSQVYFVPGQPAAAICTDQEAREEMEILCKGVEAICALETLTCGSSILKRDCIGGSTKDCEAAFAAGRTYALCSMKRIRVSWRLCLMRSSRRLQACRTDSLHDAGDCARGGSNQSACLV